jgi:hypothetical protein
MSDIDLREYYDQSYPPSVFVVPAPTSGTSATGGTTTPPAQTVTTPPDTTTNPAPAPPADTTDENC